MKRFISIALLTLSTAASANYITGNELLDRINRRDPMQDMFVYGYVSAVSDFSRGDLHCAPLNVTVGQVRDLTHQRLVREPSTRHRSASLLVAIALMEVWPCEKKSNL